MATDAPDETVVSRETTELAFLVAVQHLPPRQRARATLRDQLPDRRLDWQAARRRELSDHEQRLLREYVAAHERGDVDGLVALLHADLTFAMPPEPGTWVGRDRIVRDWVNGGFGSPSFGTWRCLVTQVNRQPAIASYLRRPDDEVSRAFALDVLTLQDGLVTDLLAFPMEVCRGLDLPESLAAR